ncbi:NAD-dependent epimerase/dehydratase family protein [Algoriphagus machipongonensis]|uniref:NAD dependent epimerase/dehydratase family protein n=1 Tax=Algoriphagus machipongonensis TaxID=388413 RepID=A3I0S7_9BACT|nr:NAD-dependent epimerase/dehydratase family protein [Algoriphagus machipongonensis]EAZ80073.1 NAD dependent epimerase/dehydratase family protein [Algoriphagus machipongonensis]
MNVALISGTSGMVGMQLLHQLLNQYDYVISVGRRKLALKHQKLVQLEGDLLEIKSWDWENLLVADTLGGELYSLKEAILEQKAEIHGFSSLGTTIKQAGSKEKFYQIDHDMVMRFAEWAKSLGATKFLYVSASGANKDSSIFYSQTKGKIEEDLKSVGFDFLGLFRPSLLLGNRSEFRLGEQIATLVMKPLVWLGVFKNLRPIYDYQVAKALVKIAKAQKTNSVEIISSGEMQDLSK